MQVALILGLAASWLVSFVACLYVDDSARTATNMALAYSNCERHPKGAHFADKPVCAQVKDIEKLYCGLRGRKDDPSSLWWHRSCICGSNLFFEKKAQCYDCVLDKHVITKAQHDILDVAIQEAEVQFCNMTKDPTEPFSKVWQQLVNSTGLEIVENKTVDSEVWQKLVNPIGLDIVEEKTVDSELVFGRFPDCRKGVYRQCTKVTSGGTVVSVRVLRNGTIISNVFSNVQGTLSRGSRGKSRISSCCVD